MTKKNNRDEIYRILKDNISECIQYILEKTLSTKLELNLETLLDIHQKKVELRIYIKQLIELDGSFTTKDYININLFYLLSRNEILGYINKENDCNKQRELINYQTYLDRCNKDD